MSARRRAFTSASTALATALALSSAAAAAGRTCEAPTVNAAAGVAARFPELLAGVRAELSNWPDLDACAHVELHRAGADAIQVVVTLPDGRSATRSAVRPDDLLATLQALLLVPQPTPSLAGAAPALAPRSVPPRPPLAPARLEAAEPGAVSANEVGRSLGVELSILGGGRMGDGQVAVGVGALSLLETHGWLFGFVGRADRYEELRRGDPQLALELGLLAGRRFHFESFALDFIAGPAIAAKNLASTETEMVQVEREPPQQQSQPQLPVEDPSTGPVPRLLMAAHAGFTPRSVLRSFVGMEASLGPARTDGAPSHSSRFPVFALGLVLGATVGTR
jgi:hypothetical protein